MRKRLTLTMLAFCCVMAQSWGFKTKGDGTTYTFDTLCEQEGSGVTYEVQQGIRIYTMSVNDTIAAGDRFDVSDARIVLLTDDVTFVIEGTADFYSQQGCLFADMGILSPANGVLMKDVSASTTFSSCYFVGVGLKFVGCAGGTLSNCTFQENNGAIGQSALVLASNGATFTIDHSVFLDNPKAAVSSAANISCNLSITNCTLTNNGTENGNTPQLNLTVADNIVIDHCTITGNPEHTMVGAIGISNFYGRTGNNITISNCTIRDNRYGIGTVGPMDIAIKDNTLVDNKYEVNPMNGGSGISLYDPLQLTNAMISGNHIEGSLWGITVIGCKNVNLGRTDVSADAPDYNAGGNTFKDNGNNGLLYDLYNNSANTVYAQNNTWNVAHQTQDEIENVIYHKADDATLGEVIYWPAATPAGIREVEGSEFQDSSFKIQDSSSEFYDLRGVRHNNPQKGINIVRKNGRAYLLHLRTRGSVK